MKARCSTPQLMKRERWMCVFKRIDATIFIRKILSSTFKLSGKILNCRTIANGDHSTTLFLKLDSPFNTYYRNKLFDFSAISLSFYNLRPFHKWKEDNSFIIQAFTSNLSIARSKSCTISKLHDQKIIHQTVPNLTYNASNVDVFLKKLSIQPKFFFWKKLEFWSLKTIFSNGTMVNFSKFLRACIIHGGSSQTKKTKFSLIWFEKLKNRKLPVKSYRRCNFLRFFNTFIEKLCGGKCFGVSRIFCLNKTRVQVLKWIYIQSYHFSDSR